MNNSGSLLPLLKGESTSGTKLVIAAESHLMCKFLLDRLTQTKDDSKSITVRWFTAGADGDLSSPALLNTIVESCHTVFLQNTCARDFDNFCQRSAVTYAADSSESFDCLLALGQICVDSDGSPEDDDDDSEPLCAPVLFIPVKIHSAGSGACKIDAYGSPFLNPLLLAARPPKTTADPVSLVLVLGTGQPAACLLPLPDGLPLGEPGRAAQHASSTDLVALDQAQMSCVELFQRIQQMSSGSTTPNALDKAAPLFLTALDRDQERLTHWWTTGSGPMAIYGSPGSGRTRSLANLAANVINAGGRLLYIVPDASAASSFAAMLEDFKVAQFAVDLSSGPSAMRCLRERFAKVREQAGSQQSSRTSEQVKRTYERHCELLAAARERLGHAAAAPTSLDNTQLYLQQFLDAQAACMASGKEMVAAACEARLLAAARILTQGERPDLGAACSDLLTTDSTDDDFVTHTPQFTELVLMLSPIVIATPEDASVWLTCMQGQDCALFDTTIIDDAYNVQPHETSRAIMLSTTNTIVVGTEAPQMVLSRMRKRNTQNEGRRGALRHHNAYEVIAAAAAGDRRLSPRNFGISFGGNYCSKTKPSSSKAEPPSRLLPVPMRVKRVLGSSFVRVDCGGDSKSKGMLKRAQKGSAAKRSESRLGNNMDAALKALQSALGAQRTLKEEAIEPLRNHLRALRGGVVNIGEARDIGTEVARIGKAIPHSHIAIVTMSTAQMHLVEAVCKAAPASTKQNTTVTVCTVFDLAAAGRCDVLLLSMTYSSRSSIGGRGVSAQRLPSLIAALCEAPRLQSVVFMTGGGATAWASSQPSSGFSAKFGKALEQLARPPNAPASASPTAPWITMLFEALSTTAGAEDDGELNDWTLLSLPFRGEVLPAIAHKSSIVLCHTGLDKSAMELEERFCVLPQMVGRWRWKHLHHVFTPSALDKDAMHELTSALVRDMCGLGRLVQLKIEAVAHNRAVLTVVPKLALSISEDATAGLSLVRTSDSEGRQRNVPRVDCEDPEAIATFVDESDGLHAACEYVYDLRDNTRGEVLQTVTVLMPSQLPEEKIFVELAGLQSGATAQLIADVSVGAPSLHAIKDSGYVYELKIRKNTEGESEQPDSETGVAWHTVVSDVLTPDLVGNGMYEFVVDDLEQGQWYAVGVSIRNSVGRGPWSFSSVQMPDAADEDIGSGDPYNDQFLDQIDDMDDGGELSDIDEDGEFDDGGIIDDLNATTSALPGKPSLQTDISTGTISWTEVHECDGFEIHARPWDVSAPGKYTRNPTLLHHTT